MENEFIGRDLRNVLSCQTWIICTTTLSELSRLHDAYVGYFGSHHMGVNDEEYYENALRARVIKFYQQGKCLEPPESRDLQDWQVWFVKTLVSFPEGEKQQASSKDEEQKPEEPTESLAAGTPMGEKPPAGNVSGRKWQEVQKDIKKYLQKNSFPGILKLAKKMQCSPGTVYKAIKDSDELKRAKKQYDNARKAKKETSPRTVGMSKAIQATKKADVRLPEEEVDIKLLIQNKSREGLIKDIIKYSKIINEHRHRNDPNTKPFDLQKVTEECEGSSHEALAVTYLAVKDEANDIHCDDPSKPAHRREV